MQERHDVLRQALLRGKLAGRAAHLQGAGSIPRCSEHESAPLSLAQRRIWLLQQLEPANPVANRPVAVRLRGHLDRSCLVRSLEAIQRRHESLRTIFPVRHGEPVQQVLAPCPLTLEEQDLRSVSPGEREAEARRRAAEETRRLFDLTAKPPLRVVLLQMSESDHVLLLLMHHIVFDGWSEGILLQELQAHYGAVVANREPGLPDLPIQYRDFALWQQRRLTGPLLEEQLTYWRHQLDDCQPIELPADYRRPTARTFTAANLSFQVPPAETAALRELSQAQGCTLFMVFLAALQAFLYRVTGERRVAVGVPIAGRNWPETEALIGVFMNLLVLRTDLSDGPSFRDLLGRVRQVALGAYEHQEAPFEKLVEVLQPERSANRWPLFQVMLNFRNLPRIDQGTATSLRMEPFPFDWGMIGGLDLSVEVQELPDGLECTFTYATELFLADTMQRLVAHFQTLLRSALAAPDRSVDRLTLLSREELHRIVVDWNRTEREPPPHACVHEWVEAQVARTPLAVAVVFEGRELTYQELNRQANHLAHGLRERGIGPNTRVGICVERSLEMVIGLLAILKAGGAYVPLDPEYPDERLAFMLQDAGVAVLLTQERLKDRPPVQGVSVICLDRLAPQSSDAGADNPDGGASRDDLVYVMYTSGTTGRPKGVQITHGAACNHLHWRAEYFPLTRADRLLQKASLGFDDSFWEIFEPLTTGAQLVLAKPGEHRDMRYLVRTIVHERITALCLVPSVMRLFLEQPGVEDCRDLRRVTTGGETLTVELQQRFFERLDAALYNGYGPTEATVACLYWRCRPQAGDSRVPIGRPISNTQIYILDPLLQPVPIGVTGEIHIGGAGLALGYLNRPELTAEKFILSPHIPSIRLYRTGDLGRYLPDGTVEFLGRRDDQVKIRGVRIEPREIEVVLREHPVVREAAVVVRTDPHGGKRLVAYVVASMAADFSAAELRSWLQRRLPVPMVPSILVPMTSLPLTPNGKLDREALPALDETIQEPFVAPRTPVEIALAGIWSEVLQTERIGVDDDFFALGGHSLLATQVTARVQDRLQVFLPLRHLFETPTIRQLAATIVQEQSVPAAPSGPSLRSLPRRYR